MPRVAVVGAGPVGLWLGAELALRGVATVVIERLPERSPYSKALTIHPRTLEMFAQRGLIDRFLGGGVPVPTGHFGVLDDRMDFRGLDTEFPFTLVFPQAATEAVLEHRARELGVDLRRGQAVREVKDLGDHVRLQVDGEGGRYGIEADYLVGCDGAGSLVRKSLGFGFPGTDADTWGFLGDVVLDRPPATPAVSHSNERGLVLAVQMANGLHRFAGYDPDQQHPGALSFEEFRASINSITGDDFGMRDPDWLSRYGNAARLASEYRRGRSFLAGDAAHLHFPAGGVGMNVGLQDAANLAWRLADVVDGHAPEALLDGYHDERHSVGADLLLGSQAQTVLIAGSSPDALALRGLLSSMIATVPEFSHALAERLSGLSVRYQAGTGNGPLAGRRAPQVVAPGTTLYGALESGQPVLVTDAELPGTSSTAEQSHVVMLRADTESFAANASWAGVRAALVRSDGYVAWSSTTTDGERLDAQAAAAIRAARPLTPVEPTP